RPPTSRLDGLALLPGAATAVLHVEHSVAAVELAGGLEDDRDLLGAIQVHGTLLRDLQSAALADRRVARDVAVVDGEGEELRQQMVGEVVSVVVRRVRLDLELLRREPVRGELVEGGVDDLRRRRIRVWGSPGPEIHVAKHDRELTLRHREGPAVLGPTEREEL